jgi:NADPH2:quinone reductase
MKAVICKHLPGPGVVGGAGALAIEELPSPEPAPDEVVVRVTAAALNFYDTLLLTGKYQQRPQLPFSPSGEIAGRITKLGAATTGRMLGDRVMAFVGWNGCREELAVKTARLIAIPDAVSDDFAAGLTVTYGTALHGLKDRGHLKPGETVAVLGASGGAGLAAIEIARLMGANVIAVASSDEKLAICREHGACHLLNYARDDLKDGLKALTGDKGVDVVYDCVGGPHAEPALRALAWEGRYLVVGFAAGEIPRIALNLLLVKGCEMAGVYFGKFVELNPERHAANMQELLLWCAEGRLLPHIHQVFPLEQTAEALRLLTDRRSVGKLIVRPCS